MAELLLASPTGHRVAARMLADEEDIHLPHLAIIETAAVFRRSVARGLLAESRAVLALEDLRLFPAIRHPHDPYLGRIWQLRANVSAYDAVYVALAENLEAVLLTGDARLTRAPLSGVRIELITAAESESEA